MKSVTYMNGVLRGFTTMCYEDDKELLTIYYHEGCGKAEHLVYTVTEDIAFTNTLEYPEEFCDNCLSIKQYNYKRDREDHSCNCEYCGY